VADAYGAELGGSCAAAGSGSFVTARRGGRADVTRSSSARAWAR